MRKREIVVTAVLAAVLVVAYLYMTGCDFTITQEQEQSQTEGVVGPDPVPSPPVVDPSDVETVRVGEYGREGCASGDGLPVGCKVLLTCTPKDADGNDVALEYAPDWSVSGPGGITPTSSNPYNARGECDTEPGTVVFTCEVAGKEGSKGYECTPPAA